MFFFCSKLIGARYYGSIDDDELMSSPIDFNGHGTHVASTAAGNPIKHASMLGLGEGTSRGGVPSARIAIYKVCKGHECDTSRIFEAFSDAVLDGVDIYNICVTWRRHRKQK